MKIIIDDEDANFSFDKKISLFEREMIRNVLLRIYEDWAKSFPNYVIDCIKNN